VALKQLSLPIKVATRVDVGRLQRELGDIDEALLQLRLRSAGAEVKMPKTSHLMDQLAEHNDLNLLQESERQELKAFLTHIKEQAPVMHVSFSADPSVAFLEKLVSWLRHEVHPEVLLTVGLQPTLGAGCIVRTTNKQFDLSLREDFRKKRDLLREKLTPATSEVTHEQ
jgi:F0F1-type ATP synthase delta subunit